MIKHLISHVIILLVGVLLRNKLQKTNYWCLEFLFCVPVQTVLVKICQIMINVFDTFKLTEFSL